MPYIVEVARSMIRPDTFMYGFPLWKLPKGAKVTFRMDEMNTLPTYPYHPSRDMYILPAVYVISKAEGRICSSISTCLSTKVITFTTGPRDK